MQPDFFFRTSCLEKKVHSFPHTIAFKGLSRITHQSFSKAIDKILQSGGSFGCLKCMPVRMPFPPRLQYGLRFVIFSHLTKLHENSREHGQDLGSFRHLFGGILFQLQEFYAMTWGGLGDHFGVDFLKGLTPVAHSGRPLIRELQCKSRTICRNLILETLHFKF